MREAGRRVRRIHTAFTQISRRDARLRTCLASSSAAHASPLNPCCDETFRAKRPPRFRGRDSWIPCLLRSPHILDTQGWTRTGHGGVDGPRGAVEDLHDLPRGTRNPALRLFRSPSSASRKSGKIQFIQGVNTLMGGNDCPRRSSFADPCSRHFFSVKNQSMASRTASCPEEGPEPVRQHGRQQQPCSRHHK